MSASADASTPPLPLLHFPLRDQRVLRRRVLRLADLAGERHRPEFAAGPRAIRVYSEEEQARIGTGGRGMLSSLEASGILGPDQREIVIDRLLALDSEEIGIEQVKWVVLMVLSSQPGQGEAYARMEDLVFDSDGSAPH